MRGVGGNGFAVNTKRQDSCRFVILSAQGRFPEAEGIEIHRQSHFPDWCINVLKKTRAVPHLSVAFFLSLVCIRAFPSQTASWEAY